MFTGEYNEYKTSITNESWKKYQSNKKIHYRKYRKILADFKDLMIEEVFTNPRGFTLPENFGFLVVAGMKNNKKSTTYSGYTAINIDYVRTGNYTYSLKWIPFKYRFWTKVFSFLTAMPIRVRITKLVKEDKFFHWVKVVKLKELKNL